MSLQKSITDVRNFLNSVSPLLTEIAETAKTLQEFRDMVSRKAKEGDLDGIYLLFERCDILRDDYIENG